MIKNINFKVDWLFLFLILLPTFYVVGRDVRNMQMNFFQMAVILLVALFHVNKYFGLFIIWTTFQFIFFDVPERSYLIQNIFFAGVMYHFITKYAVVVKKYFWAFYGLLIFNVLWIPLQVYNIDPVWSQTNPEYLNWFSEYSGFFGLPAFLGNYAAVVLPFSFLLSWWLVPFSLIAIVVSKSTFSLLAAVFSSLFFFWFYKRIVFWGLFIVLGIASFFYIFKYDLPTGQFQRRLSVWSLILKQGVKNQFLGHGIGAYHNKYSFVEVSPSHNNMMVGNNVELLKFLIVEARKNNKSELEAYLLNVPVSQLNIEEVRREVEKTGMSFQVWDKAHNEFIEAFFDYGLIGLFLIIGYLIDLFRRFLKYSKDKLTLSLASSTVAIIIVSFAHFPFHIARLAGPFICILALFETV